MSFTVMRYKDGKATPIKMSIWDAFKGVPDPKPRKHACPKCGTYHLPKPKYDLAIHLPDSKAITANTTKRIEPTKDTAPIEAKDDTQNQHDFTEAEDAIIISMKAAENSWATIAEKLGKGRTKGMVSHRFREMKHAGINVEGKATNVKEHEKPVGEMTKAEKRARAREEGLRKQAEKAKGREEAAKKEMEEARKIMEREEAKRARRVSFSEPIVSQSYTPATIPTPANIPTANDRVRWAMIVAKHYDTTGQRITAQAAYKMVMEGKIKL